MLCAITKSDAKKGQAIKASAKSLRLMPRAGIGAEIVALKQKQIIEQQKQEASFGLLWL